MTSYERLLCAVQGKRPDRTPVAPALIGVTARMNGRRILDYVRDGAVIAESQTAARKDLGHDILFAAADLSVEAEALGCRLQYADDAYPSIAGHCLRDAGDIGCLRPVDPQRDGRMPVLIEASTRLRESAGNDCVVAACMMGPLSIASQMIGLESFLYLLADSSLKAEQLIDFTEQVAISYGAALLRAGAHCLIVFDPIASPSVIPPALFAHHEAPRLKRLFSRLGAEGAALSWLSIAGATQKIVPLYSKIGIDLATIDYEVPLVQGFRLGAGIALNGNLKPFSFVSSTPDQIKESAKDCLRTAGKRNNFVIGSGCEVPVESGRENLAALVEAAEEFRTEARA